MARRVASVEDLPVLHDDLGVERDPPASGLLRGGKETDGTLNAGNYTRNLKGSFVRERHLSLHYVITH